MDKVIAATFPLPSSTSKLFHVYYVCTIEKERGRAEHVWSASDVWKRRLHPGPQTCPYEIYRNQSSICVSSISRQFGSDQTISNPLIRSLSLPFFQKKKKKEEEKNALSCCFHNCPHGLVVRVKVLSSWGGRFNPWTGHLFFHWRWSCRI